MSDACVFHGLLLLSARSFTKSSYDISYNVTALKHKVQCIQLVNEALEIDGKQTSDAIIAAVLMLAVEEVSHLLSLTNYKRILPLESNLSLRCFLGTLKSFKHTCGASD